MPAIRIDGRKFASSHLARLQAEITEFSDKFGAGPKLAVVRVGADQASASYARQIRRTFERRGASSVEIELPADADTEQTLAEICRLNADPDVHGIMLQAPLPAGIPWRQVADAVAPKKTWTAPRLRILVSWPPAIVRRSRRQPPLAGWRSCVLAARRLSVRWRPWSGAPTW